MVDEMELVLQLATTIRFARENPEMQTSCDQKCLDSLIARGKAEMGAILPAGYLSLLSVIDGFHFNGLYFLASRSRDAETSIETEIQGIVDDNVEYWTLLERGRVVIGYTENEIFHSTLDGLTFGKSWRSDEDSCTRLYSRFPELLADAADTAKIEVRSLMPADFEFSRKW